MDSGMDDLIVGCLKFVKMMVEGGRFRFCRYVCWFVGPSVGCVSFLLIFFGSDTENLTWKAEWPQAGMTSAGAVQLREILGKVTPFTDSASVDDFFLWSCQGQRLHNVHTILCCLTKKGP